MVIPPSILICYIAFRLICDRTAWTTYFLVVLSNDLMQIQRQAIAWAWNQRDVILRRKWHQTITNEKSVEVVVFLRLWVVSC